MLAGDHQPRFGQQEMHVGDTAVERILDRDDRTIGLALLHRVDRILERKARQREAVGERLLRGDMAVRPRRSLKRDRALRGVGGGGGHRGDDGTGGGGEILHAGAA